MAKIGQVGGMDLSPEMQKIYDMLVELLKGGKKLDISIAELKKKAGVSNVNNSSVSAFIIREKNKGTKFFKNISVTQFSGAFEAGSSVHDPLYKSSKKFKDFYSATYDKPWSDATATNKANAVSAFERHKGKLTKPGFTLSGEELAKKLGVSFNTLKTYFTPINVRNVDSTTASFVRDNIEKIRTIKDGKSVSLYKDPSATVMKNWKILQGSDQISSKMVERIQEYDKKFRKILLENKKLPLISEVIEQTSMKTPTTIANTEALYSRLLRGENFRRKIDIAPNVAAGKRIMDELALNTINNSRRSAFYRLALDNINKMYPNESGNLETFKTRFRNELKKIFGIKGKKAQVPFSVNEIIGLSTGQSRGVQPFSVFVDVVDTNINKGELSRYQGQFSKKLSQIQTLLSGNNPNTVEAERIALSLDTNRKTLVDSLTKKGFTTNEINKLNLPDIKVGENVLETYKAKDLARYKEAGVDIAKFAKDKGYYIDVKKGKPFFDVGEKSFKNVILQAAKTNEGGVCQIFRAEGGRIGFATGSNCARQMEFAFDSDPVRTTEQINKIKTVPEKVKSAGMGFLNFVKRGGKYGAIAAGGAAAAALVKTFMNDDPSTYLSDENQQKNMLIDMVTSPIDETPEESPAILDYQLPTLGAVTAAGMVPGGKRLYDVRRRGGVFPTAEGTKVLKPAGPARSALGLRGVLGKGLAATATPLGLAALEPLHIAAQVQQGDSLTDIATNPWNYLGPTFASGLTKEATRFAPSAVSKIMRLGMSPMALRGLSRMGGYGFAASLGIQGLQKFGDWRNKRGWFSESEE